MNQGTLHLNLLITPDHFDDMENSNLKSSQVFKAFEEKHGLVNFLSETKSDNMFINKVISGTKSIQALLKNMVPSSLKMQVNLLGDTSLWLKPDLLNDCLQFLLNLSKYETVSIYIHKDEKVFKLEAIGYTEFLTFNETHRLPEGMLNPNNVLTHELHPALLITSIAKGKNLRSHAFVGETLQLKYVKRYTFISDESGSYENNLARKIVDTFNGIGMRTQINDGPLEFLTLTNSADLFLRTNKRKEFTENQIGTDQDGCSFTKELLKHEYIAVKEVIPPVDVDDDEIIVYTLLEKGRKYRDNTISRESVTAGVSINDILYSTETGLLYKVMDYDYTSDIYALMSDDFHSLKFNPKVDAHFYKATLEERLRFEEKIK